MPRIDPAHDFGPLTAGVFDRLGFIENEQMKTLPGQFLGVAPEQGIGGQHHIVLRNFGEARLAFGTMQGQYREAGGKAGSLAFPVEDQRGRQHDQRRTIKASGLFFQ